MHKSAIVGLLAFAIVPGLSSVACNQPAPSTSETAPAAAPSKAPVSDSWITTKIEAQYFADGTVKGRNIDVTTTNGVVVLAGHVDTDQAKQQALDIARRTDGVTNVEDHLIVGTEAPSPAASAGSAGNRIASGWITTKIQAQYFADPVVKGHEIDVDTANGVVTLTGTVDTDAARERAVAVARQTDGVRDVENHLTVQSVAPASPNGTGVIAALTDAEITSRVQSKYFVDDEVKAREVNVDTSSGVVTLSGTVDSERAHHQAVRLARRTSGVREVRDQLRVEATAATTGRQAVESTAKNLGDAIEDAWITSKIQSKYFLDGEVKGHNIDVTTRNGVVTLTGDVESPQARQQALDLARETNGVSRVVDRLKIKRS